MDLLQVFLNKAHTVPLYGQLYGYLVGEIQAGRLAPGEKLPGKRTAAQQLGVSINTVDQAYQMLAAEGYVAARPRSGFVVNALERRLVPPLGPIGQSAPPPLPPVEAGGLPVWRYSFATGDIDTALFPQKTWNRLFREVLAGENSLFARGEPLGDAVLREAIAQYLRGYRGVHCEAAQLVVGAGLEVLVGMLVRLFPGVAVGVEDPGYPKIRHILHNMGNTALPVAVDADGMRAAALAGSGATLAYVTPSHQFPTGAVMPVGRRTELLHWAAEGGHLLVEDDYDSEFRFDGRPLPSLQGLDGGGHVVYAGTFSRSLAPGIRAAYLVLPPALLARWREAYGDYACTVSRPEQHTLARFMAQGHFSRSVNRMRAVYKKRRGALLDALAANLPHTRYETQNTHTGLYLIVRLPGLDAVAVAAAARQAGIRLRALDEYRMETAGGNRSGTCDALVLGYGGLGDEDVDGAVAALARCIGTFAARRA